MANQPPARQWFRLPVIARPAAPTTTPALVPPPPQPRPPIGRPAFRPGVQPQPQPQPAPTQPTSPPPAGITSVPTSPTVRAEGGVASVPTSPTPRATASTSSLPTSPAPASARVPVSTSSLPPSPTPKPVPTAFSVPTSPAPKPAPSASVPPSPAPKPVATSSVPTSPASKPVTTTVTRVPSPEPSLIRTVKPAIQTPPQSPKPKPTAPPPSPLTLPPSQVKSEAEPKIPLVAEQKTVLFQKTIDKPKASRLNGSDLQKDFVDTLNSSIAQLAKQETSKDVETKERGHRKKISSDSEDVGMRVITIAGENKGAFMEVIHSPKKHVFEGTSRFLHKKDNPRSDGSDWGSHSSSGEEGNIKKKDKNHKGRSVEANPLSAFMNSNVQGVNNSVICNSSCTHHDPGVHLALSRKPAGSGFHIKDRGANGYQS